MGAAEVGLGLLGARRLELAWELLHFFFMSTALPVVCVEGGGGKRKQAKKFKRSGGLGAALRQEQSFGGVAWKCARDRSVVPRPPSSERVLQRFTSLQAGSAPGDVTGWSSGTRRLDE